MASTDQTFCFSRRWPRWTRPTTRSGRSSFPESRSALRTRSTRRSWTSCCSDLCEINNLPTAAALNAHLREKGSFMYRNTYWLNEAPSAADGITGPLLIHLHSFQLLLDYSKIICDKNVRSSISSSIKRCVHIWWSLVVLTIFKSPLIKIICLRLKKRLKKMEWA